MDLLTHHARARMQQRGISAARLNVLLDFGRTARAGSGCEVVFFDRKARQRLARAGVISPSEADRICKSYAIVEADSGVITVGHRTRRITRNR